MITPQEKGLLVLALITALAGLTRPAAQPSAEQLSCHRPAALARDGREILLCLERIPSRRALQQAGCPAEPPAGVLWRATDRCPAAEKPLPAAWLLQLGLKVDINRATAEDLEELPGIGPALARRIVQWRDQRGWIDDLEELLEVNGIGPKRLEILKKALQVGPQDVVSPTPASDKIVPER